MDIGDMLLCSKFYVLTDEHELRSIFDKHDVGSVSDIAVEARNQD